MASRCITYGILDQGGRSIVNFGCVGDRSIPPQSRRIKAAMKFTFATVLLTASVVRAADPVPLDVKTGQWEATVTSQITGLPQARPQLSPDQLAKLPPEQRAKVEAMMAGGAHTSTSKSC